MDQFYYESGYIDDSYFVYVADAACSAETTTTVTCVGGKILTAESQQAVEFAQSVTASRIVDAVSSVSVEFAQTTLASRATDIDLFAFGEAAIAAQVSRIRDNNVETSTVFSISAEVTRIRDLDADAAAIISAIINGSRSLIGSSAAQAAFSISADAGAIRNFSDYFILENRTAKTVSRVSTFLDSSQSQFGGYSARFLGNSRLEIPTSTDFAFGSDAWTIEFWFRSSTNSSTHSFIDWRTTASQNTPWIFLNNEEIRVRIGGSDRLIDTVNLNNNQWYHVAVTRLGTAHRLFVNGVQRSLWTATVNYVQGGTVKIGEDYLNGNDFFGWIDDVRIVKGSALYTANFTPPTQQLEDISNTVLLLNMNLVTTETDFVDTVGITSGYQVVNYESTNTVNADITKLTGISAGLSSQITLTASSNLIKSAASSIQSTTALTAQGLTTKDIVLTAFTDGSLAAAADRSRNIESHQLCESTINAEIKADYNPSLAFSSSGSLSFLGGIVVENSALLQSRFNIFASRNFGGPRPRHSPVTSGGLNTTVKQFGTASFNGTAQFNPSLTSPSVPVPTAGQSFVFEWWQYDYATGSTGNKIWFNYNDSPRGPLRLRRSNTSTGNVFLERFISSPDNWEILISGTAATSVLNQWAHYLIVRDSSRYSLYINGSRRATTTNNVNIDFSLTESIGYNISSDSLLYLDDFSLHIGTTLGYNPSSSTITVPSAPRQNTDNTVFLYHFDDIVSGNILDDVSLTQLFAANLQSTTTLTAAGGAPVRFTAALTAQSQLTVQAAKNSEIILTAFSDAALSAAVGKITEGQSSISSEFTQTATAIKQVFGDADIDSASAVSATAVKSVTAEISTESIATQLTAAVKVGDVIIDANSAFEQVTTAVKITSTDAAFSSETQLTGDGDLLVDYEAALTSTATAVIDSDRTRSTAASLASAVTQTTVAAKTVTAESAQAAEFVMETATPGVISAGASLLVVTGALTAQGTLSKDNAATAEAQTALAANVSANTDILEEFFVNTQQSVIFARDRSTPIATSSIATQLTAAAVTSVTSSQMTVTATVDVDAIKTTGNASIQTTETTLTADIGIIKTADSSQSASFDVSAEGSLDVFGSADLSANSALTAQVQKTTEIILTAFSDAELSTTVGRTRTASSTQTSQASVTAEGGRLISAEIATTSIATQLTLGGQIAGGISLQVSAATLSIDPRVLNLTLYVYQIPPESRLRVVTEETRTYQVRR